MSVSKFSATKGDYSTFPLNHMHRTSFDMGNLFPVMVDATMPGDVYSGNIGAFVRGMPTISPILDKVDIKLNAFYVPYRILYDKFGDFLTQNDTWKITGDEIPSIPVCLAPPNIGDKYPSGRLADYLGVSKYYMKGTDGSVPEPISAFPFLAYQKIYLDYYAPQRWVNYVNGNMPGHDLIDLQVGLNFAKNKAGSTQFQMRDDGDLSNVDWLFKMRKVGWNHDYLTNALPTPEVFDSAKIQILDPKYRSTGEENLENGFDITKGRKLLFPGTPVSGFNNEMRLASVRDLRNSIATQHYLERLSYSGGRYMEATQLIWGQKLDNAMLQRAEYVGGSVLNLFVNEVEQTATTSEGQLGDLGGKPVGAGTSDYINFTADEFGVFMILAHVVPKRSYADAMDKKLWITPKTQLEYPSRIFEGIGDEPVYRYEVSGKSWNRDNENGFGSQDIFGYVPKYSNWKTSLDRFTGEMRYSLLHWHLGSTAEELDQYKTVSPEFINCNPREDIFLVPNEPDKFLGTFSFNFKVKRKLSGNILPGINRI